MDDVEEQGQMFEANGCYDWRGHGLHCGECLERQMVEPEEADPCAQPNQHCVLCDKRMDAVHETW